MCLDCLRVAGIMEPNSKKALVHQGEEGEDKEEAKKVIGEAEEKRVAEAMESEMFEDLDNDTPLMALAPRTSVVIGPPSISLA